MANKVLPQSKYLDPIEETSENHPSRQMSMEQVHEDEVFSGPVAARECTDLPCLLAFVVLTFGLVAAAVFSNQ